jgi:hypothetical protein
MIVDCDLCAVRGEACGDCVITVLLGAPPGGVRLDVTERLAIDALANAGLVPRLRLVPVGPQATGDISTAEITDVDEVAGWTRERAERSTREAG